MTKYIEIQKVREHDIVVDEYITLKSNTFAFMEGDIISITEKLDGAQTHICYDSDDHKLLCFSSNQELSENHTLRGFYDYVKTLDMTPFEKYPDYDFYGEWLVPHTVIYDESNYDKWYLFSVYDKANKRYLPQSFVKGFALKYHFNYPHELYYGPFRGWDHIYGFANSPSYGPSQEGIVIKNQTALDSGRGPHILKYVNDSFKETKIENHMRKVDKAGSDKKAEYSVADEYAAMIVTPARVTKILHKMIDEDIIPREISPKNMGVIAKNLPSRVYDDCIKEEHDIVMKAGPFGRKAIYSLSMNIAKEILHIH